MQYNAISNGGDTPGQWRVLTQEEMSYILGREDIAYSFAKVFVNGVRGLLLFPDDFECPSQLTPPNGLNDRTFAFNNDEISHLDNSWQSLESAGAVFLPQTGQRNSTAFSNETQGLYWLSNYSSNNRASYFSIKLADITCNTTTARHYGYAVRLVHDVE